MFHVKHVARRRAVADGGRRWWVSAEADMGTVGAGALDLRPYDGRGGPAVRKEPSIDGKQQKGW